MSYRSGNEMRSQVDLLLAQIHAPNVRFDALDEILVDRNAAYIPYLFPLLKEKRTDVRDRIMAAISILLGQIQNKRNYYENLKHIEISAFDLDSYKWQWSTSHFVTLLAIASMNRNGRIREQAVSELSEVKHRKAIRFLIFRLADWVGPVRNRAWNGLQSYLKPEFASAFVPELPLLDWMQKVERTDLKAISARLWRFLLEENREIMVSDIGAYPEVPRLLLAKKLSETMEPHEIGLFLGDRNFLVRSLVADHIDRLDASQIERLLQDKSAKVRHKIILKLIDRREFEPIAKHYLTDISSSVRVLARFALKSQNLDLGRFYNHCLSENMRVEGALAGLVEVGGKDYLENVKPFLQHPRTRIKKAAYRAYYALDEDNRVGFALDNLDHDLPGIRKLMAENLRFHPTPEVLAKARHLYENGNLI